jgi:hypothetical protein
MRLTCLGNIFIIIRLFLFKENVYIHGETSINKCSSSLLNIIYVNRKLLLWYLDNRWNEKNCKHCSWTSWKAWSRDIIFRLYLSMGRLIIKFIVELEQYFYSWIMEHINTTPGNTNFKNSDVIWLKNYSLLAFKSNVA